MTTSDDESSRAKPTNDPAEVAASTTTANSNATATTGSPTAGAGSVATPSTGSRKVAAVASLPTVSIDNLNLPQDTTIHSDDDEKDRKIKEMARYLHLLDDAGVVGEYEKRQAEQQNIETSLEMTNLGYAALPPRDRTAVDELTDPASANKRTKRRADTKQKLEAQAQDMAVEHGNLKKKRLLDGVGPFHCVIGQNQEEGVEVRYHEDPYLNEIGQVLNNGLAAPQEIAQNCWKISNYLAEKCKKATKSKYDAQKEQLSPNFRGTLDASVADGIALAAWEYQKIAKELPPASVTECGKAWTVKTRNFYQSFRKAYLKALLSHIFYTTDDNTIGEIPQSGDLFDHIVFPLAKLLSQLLNPTMRWDIESAKLFTHPNNANYKNQFNQRIRNERAATYSFEGMLTVLHSLEKEDPGLKRKSSRDHWRTVIGRCGSGMNINFALAMARLYSDMDDTIVAAQSTHLTALEANLAGLCKLNRGQKLWRSGPTDTPGGLLTLQANQATAAPAARMPPAGVQGGELGSNVDEQEDDDEA